MKWFFVCFAIIAVCIIFNKWLFEAVMATNWPEWVKYMILRG